MSPVGPAFTSRRKKEEKKNTKKFVLSYPALHQHTYNQLPIHFHLSSSSPSITQFMNNNIHHRSTSTQKKKKSCRNHPNKKNQTHLKLIEYPNSTSINVNAAIVCTPGDTAKNFIRTD